MANRASAEEREYYSLVKRAFRLWAPFYDLFTLPISRVREKTVEFAGARKGSSVLDVGTGTGALAVAFAKKGYRVVGVDISEEMLAKAGKKRSAAEFAYADATKLPFGDNSFDVTCSSFMLHDMPFVIRKRALKEMARVTKPDGMVVIVDYDLPRNRLGSFLAYRLMRLFEGPYYAEFIGSDLEALLWECGIKVERRLPVIFGAGRILKAAVVK